MQPLDEIYRLSSVQHGVLARRQLAEMIGRSDADHLLATSRFERLLRGVYRVRGGAVHPHQLALAAALRSGPDATLTGPGALGLLDQLLELNDTIATGDGERAVARLVARSDPPAETQVWVSPWHRVDFYFRILRLAIEYQGRADHATETGRASDRVRDEELTLAGIRLIYVTAEDLRDERALLARLGAALTARADELGLPAPRLIGS